MRTPKERAERVQRKLLELGIAIHNSDVLERAFDDRDLLDEVDTLQSQLIKTNDIVSELHSRLSRLETIIDNERGDESECEVLPGSMWINIPKLNLEISAYLVTQKQWVQIMGYNPSHFKGDDLPVEMVSFEDCNKFIQKLNASQSKYIYRLPTDEEWQYCSNTEGLEEIQNIQDYAWVTENSERKTHPVGLKKPTEHGLYDMYGDVWEWTSTLYHRFGGHSYIVHGGGWFSDSQYVCSRKSPSPAHYRSSDMGLRLVRVAMKDKSNEA